MSRIEYLRGKVSAGSSTLNQHEVKAIAEVQKRQNGDTRSKGYKAEQRRDQDAQFVRDWIKRQSELNLRPKQRVKLALKRGSDRDVQLLFENLDDFGKLGYQVDVFTFPAKDQAESEKTELAPLESETA